MWWIILAALSLILCAVYGVRYPCNKASARNARNVPNREFYEFQQEYLVVYSLVMFADWLQGTNMYLLYQFYEVDIPTLFLTGFVSSAIFGTIIGGFIDQIGRKNACMLYCVLEIIINALEHSKNFNILILGRIFGGVSTSLLFSAFESWMVTQHRQRGFSEDWLSETFSKASIANGFLAILAGLISHTATHYGGIMGPFQLAILITVIAAKKVSSWPEILLKVTSATSSSEEMGYWKKLRRVLSTPSSLLTGLGYSLFDGPVFVFVFMWVPTLQEIQGDGKHLPTGLVFACFMLCIAIGGKLFERLSAVYSADSIGLLTTLISWVSLLIPTISSNYGLVLLSFMMFEGATGMYSPCSAMLRSQYIKTEDLSSMLTFFRMPLNVFVVTGTKMSDIYSRESVFAFCSVGMFLSVLSHGMLKHNSRKSRVE